MSNVGAAARRDRRAPCANIDASRLPRLRACRCCSLRGAARRRASGRCSTRRATSRSSSATSSSSRPALMLLIIVPVIVADRRVRLALSREQQGRDLRSRLRPFDRARTGHLGGAAADHHLPRRADLVEHASARSVPPARPDLGGQAGRSARPSRSTCRSSRSTGNGCSSIPNRASRRSTNWRCRSIARSAST